MKFTYQPLALAPVGISRIWGKLRLAETMIVSYFTRSILLFSTSLLTQLNLYPHRPPKSIYTEFYNDFFVVNTLLVSLFFFEEGPHIRADVQPFFPSAHFFFSPSIIRFSRFDQRRKLLYFFIDLITLHVGAFVLVIGYDGHPT